MSLSHRIVPLVALVLAGGASAQVTQFSYSARVVEKKDDLGILGAVAISDVLEGVFSFQQTQEGVPLDQIDPFTLNAFELAELALVVGSEAFAVEFGVLLVVDDGPPLGDFEIPFEPRDSALLGGFFPVVGVGAATDGSIEVTLIGPTDWFGPNELPDPETLGLELLETASVVLELSGPGVGESEIKLQIERIDFVAGATIVEIGSDADLASPFGELDFGDVSYFISEFSAGSTNVDVAAPFGEVNFADVTAFITAFNSGS